MALSHPGLICLLPVLPAGLAAPSLQRTACSTQSAGAAAGQPAYEQSRYSNAGGCPALPTQRPAKR